MAVVRNKGNDAEPIDQAQRGHYDLQAIEFRGTVQDLTISGTKADSANFSKRCTAIRVAPTGNIRYRINAAATATGLYLAAGAVEIIPIHTYPSYISIIQDGAATGKVSVTEDA